MNVNAPGFHEKPNHQPSAPPESFPDQSQRTVNAFLDSVLMDVRGLGMLCGPTSSGKTIACRRFINTLDRDIRVAMVDGTGLNTISLLSTILAGFSCEFEHASPEALWAAVSKFASQQTRCSQAPLVVIRNLDKLLPGAMQSVCELASLQMHYRFALRLVLVSTRASYSMLNSPAMNAISRRLAGVLEMEAPGVSRRDTKPR